MEKMELVGLLCLVFCCWTQMADTLVLGNSPYGNQDIISVRSRGMNPAQEQEGPQPIFDPEVQRNVTAVATQTAFLHCKVKDLGAKAVSWIRQQDLHILTAGLFTYTSDQRFSVVQQPASVEDWILQIKFVQPRDAGVYECQVSTEPRISMDFYLNVVESTAKIMGPAEVYVKQGSTLSLTCIVTHAVDNAVVFWYHDINVLDDATRRHVNIDLVHDPTTATLSSRLRINNVQAIHSGNYTCLPTAADPVSVIVHIINGEHPAAMQHGNSAAPFSRPGAAWAVSILSACISLLFSHPLLAVHITGLV